MIPAHCLDRLSGAGCADTRISERPSLSNVSGDSGSRAYI